MRYDFSPLYRSTVGFDRLFDMFDHEIENAASGPAYDIEKVTEDSYRISLVVAGFALDEIEMVQQENELVVSGRRKATEETTQYLHRGIANRSFKQSFNLAQHLKVVNATLDNGILTIDLKREVPEALKPRRINIADGGAAQTIQQDTASKPDQIGRRGQAA